MKLTGTVLPVIISLSALSFNQYSNWKNESAVEFFRKIQSKALKECPIQDDDWRTKARKMVSTQIKSRGIKDERVLKAMEETPRHLFVPEKHRHRAWEDNPLPIDKNQTISQPYIVALMTESLHLSGREKVLEIGTGSGYQAAILSQLSKEVFSMEIFPSLAETASGLLDRLGYSNVRVRCGDGYSGWPEKAPFDAIIVTAAPEEIPSKLLEQLRPGGIMVLPSGSLAQELKVISKSADGKTSERFVSWVRFVPMLHPKDTAR